MPDICFTGPFALLPTTRHQNVHRKYFSVTLSALFSFLCACSVTLLLPFTYSLPAYAEQQKNTVRLQLHWTHQFEFAGYYAAQAQGYYKEEGLNVIIKEGGPDITPLSLLQADEVDIIIGNSEILLARLDGKPVVALAAIFQHSASALLTLAGSDLHTPQDLTGKTVEMGDRFSDAEMYAMLSNEGLSLDQIRRVDSSFSLESLISGGVDAVSSYISNQPFYLKKRGIPFRLIRPVWYGIDFYGDLIATSESYLAKHADTAERFTRASVKGWEYAFTHPDEIIALILNDYATAPYAPSKAKLYYEFAQMQKLVMPDVIEIGHINEGRFRHMADTFVNLGLADAGYSLDGFVWQPEQATLDWNNQTVRLLLGAIFSSAGLVLVLIGIITHLKNKAVRGTQTGKERQQNEQRMLLALQGASLGYWEWEHETGELFIDSQTAELLGLDETNHTLTPTSPHTIANETARRFYETLEQQLADGIDQFEIDFASFNTAKTGWLQCKGGIALRDDRNTPICSSGILQDNSMLRSYQEELEELSITDIITGIHNRRYLFQQMELQLDEVRTKEAVLTLALIQIDNMAKLRETYGRLSSETVLKDAAWVLHDSMRPYDIIARFDGEVFIMLFMNADKQQAAEYMKEIQAQLARTTFYIHDFHVQLSVSVALLDSTELSANQLLPETFIMEADKRMLLGQKTQHANTIILE